ncbi:MAG: mannose-6-phosphate isomerase, class I [Sphaerochaetaceae bacterium]
MDFIKIQGAQKDYAWGNEEFISNFLGKDKQRIAELWWGCHPQGPNYIDDKLTLSKYIEENPEAIGKNKSFPFLFKILAIESMLSLQVHPDKKAAEEGWTKEEPFHSKLDRSDWNYQDSNQKAEMLMALTPVTAMCGFRPFSKIQENLKTLLKNSYSYFSKAKDIKEFFHILYTLEKPDLMLCINEYKKFLWKMDDLCVGAFLTEYQIASQCLEKYKTDPAVFAPFFMNVVNLSPGDAMYLQPRVIHSYVYGNGVELMNNSNNVLRAGLTNKHMDLKELEMISIFESTEPQILNSEFRSSGKNFLLPFGVDQDFKLTQCRKGEFEFSDKEVRIAFCFEGKAEFESDSQKFELKKGEACFIDYRCKNFTLNAKEGLVYVASNGK